MNHRRDEWIARNRTDIHPSWFNRLGSNTVTSCEDLLIHTLRLAPLGRDIDRERAVYDWATKNKDASAFEATYRMGGVGACVSLIAEWADEQTADSLRLEARRKARRTP